MGRWQVDLLAYLAAPNTGGNVDVLTMWADSEGVQPYANNWLATGWVTLDSVPYNSDGVQAYPDQATGVAAIGDTLLKSPPQYLYSDIVNGLREDIGPHFQMWAYINRSSWCSGCDSGYYPNVFYGYLQGQGEVEQGVYAGPGSTSAGPVDVSHMAQSTRAAFEGLRSFANQGAGDLGEGIAWIKQAIDNVNL